METLAFVLNFVGLTMITTGGILAAISAPAPSYGPDGSVSMAPAEMQGEAGKGMRIRMHYRQKHFPKFLKMIAAGAFLQAFAMLVPLL